MVPNHDSLPKRKGETPRLATILKFLFLPMRLVAIEMDPFANYSTWQLFCGRLFALAMLFINTWTCVYSTVLDTSPLMEWNKSINSSYYQHFQAVTSNSDLWSIMIDYNSFNCFSIGSHAALLSLAFQTKWKTLWKELQQLAVEIIDNSDHFNGQCHRAVSVSILLFLMV